MSVEAVQERLICEDEVAVAVKFAGAVGGVVSEAIVLAVEFPEKVLRLFAASVARTR